ncbi:hypothetical protein [Streptomyces sp. NPDC004726]
MMFSLRSRTVVLDIDGTLCCDGRAIDDRILSAIGECERVGAHPALDGVAHVAVAPDPEAVAAEITLPARTARTAVR